MSQENTGQQITLQALPSMSRLMGTEAFAQLAAEYGAGLAKFQLREVVGACRAARPDRKSVV